MELIGNGVQELKLDVEDLVRVKERQAGFYHVNLLQEQLDQYAFLSRSIAENR